LCRWYRDARDRFRRVIVGWCSPPRWRQPWRSRQGFVDPRSSTARSGPTCSAPPEPGRCQQDGAVAGFWTVGAMVPARRC
jgi:hypothetical protein